jgi:hypothetical protein
MSSTYRHIMAVYDGASRFICQHGSATAKVRRGRLHAVKGGRYDWTTGPCSLRVSIVVFAFFVIVVFAFLAIVAPFLFVFLVVWLISHQDIGR